MVLVEEAAEIIRKSVLKLPTEVVSVSHAVGRVLAESIVADRDFPPFDRVAMDGIAIQFSDWQNGQRRFEVVGVQPAGSPALSLKAGACLEAMTGAMLPAGADTIIRYEDISIANGVATVSVNEVTIGQNVHGQGVDVKRDSNLLTPPFRISPAEVALLASVGRSSVRVERLPRVIVVASGEELVDVNDTPLPYQIRRSNTYALVAALHDLGIEAQQVHFRDEVTELREGLRLAINNHDVVILSGGVSKGKYDFIPQVLTDLSIERKFHEVSQRPGKPMWFGRGDNKIVFALPGNPVSTFMCFYRYVKPWLTENLGIVWRDEYAVLTQEVSFKPALTYFLQVRIVNDQGVMKAYPLAGGGSGDFANLKDVDGFLELPPDRIEFKAGESFKFYRFR